MVICRKYFHAQYFLNLPSTWGLGITRICVFNFHLKLVESANSGLIFFVLFAIDARNLSSIKNLMFSNRKRIYFFNAAKQILHLHNGLLYLQTNRVQLFLLKHKNSEVYIVKCKIKLEALERIVLRYDHARWRYK